MPPRSSSRWVHTPLIFAARMPNFSVQGRRRRPSWRLFVLAHEKLRPANNTKTWDGHLRNGDAACWWFCQVNFTVTRSGLEGQLLGVTIQFEQVGAVMMMMMMMMMIMMIMLMMMTKMQTMVMMIVLMMLIMVTVVFMMMTLTVLIIPKQSTVCVTRTSEMRCQC
jgi:hypothetical protein